MSCWRDLKMVKSEAEFGGPGDRYRYWLLREWNSQLPRFTFVLLNPSYASGEVSDDTLKRVLHFAASDGAGVIEIVNLFAFVDTNQTSIYSEPHPVGETPEENDQWIRDSVRRTDKVVVGWGGGNANAAQRAGTTTEAVILPRVAEVRCLLPEEDLYSVGKVQTGPPPHPQRLSDRTRIVPYLWPSDYPFPRRPRQPGGPK